MTTPHNDQAYAERVTLKDAVYEPLTLPPEDERTREWYAQHVLPKLNRRGLAAIVRAAIRPDGDTQESA